MLKKYRRHFIILNMVLVGLLLLTAFVVIGITTYHNSYSELKNTMSLVIKPFNSSSEPRNENKKQPPKKPENETDTHTNNNPNNNPDNAPPQPKEPEKKSHYTDDNITTVFYNPKEDTISVLSETLAVESNINDVVYEVAKQKDSFGTIEKYNVIYYREKTENNYKIALTDTWYIRSRILKVSVVLTLIFIISMGLLFLLSLKMSQIAAKPMEKAIEMERQFVADISHDLKTPITVILANNSIVKSSPQSSVQEQKQWLDSTDTAAKEMMTMVSEMLTLSSLESVDKSVSRTQVNLSSSAEKSVLQLESVAYERNIILESDIEENIFILSDIEYTKRICDCLIENALKYEPDGGKVKVSVSVSKKNAVFSVQNFGSVILPEDLPHIFDRFYRGDKTRNIKKGHGLGLPIIKRMTELLNAHIQAESSQQIGTVFTVFFN